MLAKDISAKSCYLLHTRQDINIKTFIYSYLVRQDAYITACVFTHGL